MLHRLRAKRWEGLPNLRSGYVRRRRLLQREGFVPKDGKDSISCATATCGDGDCCDTKGSCKDYTCSAGFVPKAGKNNLVCPAATCYDGDCCDQNGSCADYTCSSGFEPKDGKDSISCATGTCGDGDCCDQKGSCADYTCSAGFAPKAGKDSISCAAATCGDGDCCDKEVMGSCKDYTCPKDYAEKPDKASRQCAAAACVPQDCCNPDVGYCMMYGDPHFTTFDNSASIFLGTRDVWLVKSKDVFIQGRSLSVSGNAAGIAVGGAFMNNKILTIELDSDLQKSSER